MPSCTHKNNAKDVWNPQARREEKKRVTLTKVKLPFYLDVANLPHMGTYIKFELTTNYSYQDMYQDLETKLTVIERLYVGNLHRRL